MPGLFVLLYSCNREVTYDNFAGFAQGTTYSIVFGNSDGYSSIELRKQDIYSNFVDRLWKTVGVRLLTKYLEGLRDGKQYRFGTAIVNDRGIELERKKFFSNNR